MSLKDIRNFDYVILLCRNMKETRAFDKDVMGFRRRGRLRQLGELQGGRYTATLRPRGPSLAWNEARRRPARPRFSSPSVCRRPRSTPVMPSWCRKASRSYEHRPTCRTGGHRTMFFRDPEDNVVEIYAEY